MDYERFLNPSKKEDLLYLLRKIHTAAENCPDAFSLASGAPNPESVPIARATFHCQDGTDVEVNENEMREALKYQSSEGMVRLLDWIKAIHKKYHNPPILNHANESIRFSSCVTAGGAMGAMHLLYSQFIQNDEVVLTDKYIFGGSICCLKRAGAIMLGVEMDSKGITPKSLRDCIENWKERAIEQGTSSKTDLKPPKLLYTIPTGQNPTGIVVPIERKKEIYKIAQEHNLLIIEDDPYFYIQYNQSLVPSYQAIDTDGRVIRIDSMSKFIAPGTRLGWISGPSAITERVADAQTTACMSASSLSQMSSAWHKKDVFNTFRPTFNRASLDSKHSLEGVCVWKLLTLKLFDKWGMDGIAERIEYLQNFYKPMRDEVESALEKYLSEYVDWYPAEAGFFFWLKLKSGKDTMFLADIEISKKYGVFAVPGIDFSCSGENGPYFRISFSYTPKNKLDEAIKRLAKFIQEVTEE